MRAMCPVRIFGIPGALGYPLGTGHHRLSRVNADKVRMPLRKIHHPAGAYTAEEKRSSPR